MENNIFEGAKFGDKFLTRNNKMAILIGFNPYVVCISDEQMHEYPYVVDYNGSINDGQLRTKFDIVSKYKEPINEYKLDEYAHNYYKRHYDFANYMLVTESYKAGYRSAFNNKAKEK